MLNPCDVLTIHLPPGFAVLEVEAAAPQKRDAILENDPCLRKGCRNDYYFATSPMERARRIDNRSCNTGDDCAFPVTPGDADRGIPGPREGSTNEPCFPGQHNQPLAVSVAASEF